VTLDGTASSDSDGTVVSWVWKEGGNQIAVGSTAGVSLGVGTHVITLEVTDDDGATDDDTVTITVAAGAGGVWLSYTTGDFWGMENWNNTELRIVAKDGENDVWQMDVIVPKTGTNSTHSIATPGIICSFLDLQHGGTPYEYSPKWATGGDVWGSGMMTFTQMAQFGAVAGADFTYDTTHDTYFEYRWTTTGLVHLGSATDPTNTVDTVLTVRINAPTMSGTGYTTTMTAKLEVTNNQTSSLDTWYMASTAGAMELGLIGSGGAFINPTDATAKPIVHGLDEHPLYAVTDWYGSTVTTIDGALMRAEVQNNIATQALNMRAGLKFELEAPTMGLYYNGLSGLMYGSTGNTSGGSLICAIAQPGAFGSGVMIAPAQTLEINFTGLIDAPGGGVNAPPVADAGPDQTPTADGTGSALVTLDGTASSDSDGAIVSWIWKEGGNQIAAGSTAQVSLGVGVHTITLVVTDDDGATDDDTVTVTVGYRLLDISAATDYNWVYENSTTRTLNRHKVVLTVTLVQEALIGEAYNVLFEEDVLGPGVVNSFVITAAGGNVYNVKGQFIGPPPGYNPILGSLGVHTLKVTYTGVTSGQTDNASVSVALRKLGDIDGSGGVGLQDKVQLNKALNGLPYAPLTVRNMDLNGGGSADLQDKVIINLVLNGLVVQ